MNRILIACSSEKAAERGLNLASDLSVATGARLSLAYARKGAITPSSAFDALGLLSNGLFTPGARNPVTAFAAPVAVRETTQWLGDFRSRVEECWESEWPGMLPGIHSRKPDLIVACDQDLASILVARTKAPVWHLPAKPGRSWFSARRIRCAVSGARAQDWAGVFAAGLGAELETTRTGLLLGGDADLVVVAREEGITMMESLTMRMWSPQPVVVV